MLESIPVTILVGTVLGFLSGVGVGGGSLLMIWLTLIIGMSHSDARVINLLFFIPSAVIASIFRLKQGKLSFKKILPAILSGCIAATVFALSSKAIDTALLKKLFGLLLLFTGFRELLYKPNQRHRNAR